MTVSVSSQAYVFLCSVAGGVVIALVYDIFRIMRKVIKTGSLFTYVEDLLFWILVAVVMFATVYYSNEGELRSYIFLGTLLGVVLYALLLSKAIMNSSLFIIRIVKGVLRFLWMVLSFPIRVIIRIFAIPGKAAARYAGNSLKKIRRAGRNKLSRAAFWRKAFRNIRKKI
ncbi:MAG: spore cortex biosynthesis protein YabQ [Ruminiclostridium sp.]|nr:spore cortex biosynthesis protein YabQ [Ruminiclostridium sp.]